MKGCVKHVPRSFVCYLLTFALIGCIPVTDKLYVSL